MYTFSQVKWKTRYIIYYCQLKQSIFKFVKSIFNTLYIKIYQSALNLKSFNQIKAGHLEQKACEFVLYEFLDFDIYRLIACSDPWIEYKMFPAMILWFLLQGRDLISLTLLHCAYSTEFFLICGFLKILRYIPIFLEPWKCHLNINCLELSDINVCKICIKIDNR